MLMVTWTKFRLVLPAICILLAPIHATAWADSDGKPDPEPKIKVTVKKGRATGIVDMITGTNVNSNPPPRTWGGTSNSPRKLTDKQRREAVLACLRRAADPSCFGTDTLDANSATLTGPVAYAMALTLVANLRFPAPTPKFGPNPNNNEWKMLAVGFPVWLWTDGPTSVSTSASASGFTFRMSARLRSTTFHMGDGRSLTCTSMAKYSSAVSPAAPSPDCGHVYTRPSLPKGKYTVRAVADWDVSWSVAGFSGVIPAYNEASATIPIGELVALNR